MAEISTLEPTRLFLRRAPGGGKSDDPLSFPETVTKLCSFERPVEGFPNVYIPDDLDGETIVQEVESAFGSLALKCPGYQKHPQEADAMLKRLTPCEAKAIMAYTHPGPLYAYLNANLMSDRRAAGVVEHIGPFFALLYRGLEKLERVTVSAHRGVRVGDITPLKDTFDNYKELLPPDRELNFWGFSSFSLSDAVATDPNFFGTSGEEGIVYSCGKLAAVNVAPLSMIRKDEQEVLPLPPLRVKVQTSLKVIKTKLSTSVEQINGESDCYVVPRPGLNARQTPPEPAPDPAKLQPLVDRGWLSKDLTGYVVPALAWMGEKIDEDDVLLLALHCRQLQRLDVNRTDGKITDASITAVAQNCTQLQYLDVSHTDGKVTDESITAVVQHCQQLQQLDVSGTYGKITDVSIMAVAQQYRQLQHLGVGSTMGKITDASIVAVAQNCPQLQHLVVNHTDGKVTDVSITVVAQNCRRLQYLDVSYMDGKITDASITTVAQNCPLLQYLDVSGTYGKITDVSITLVAQNCRQLQHLRVAGTGGRVTDASMTVVAQHCPELQHLDVATTCGRITDASITLVKQKTKAKVNTTFP